MTHLQNIFETSVFTAFITETLWVVFKLYSSEQNQCSTEVSKPNLFDFPIA